jgi:hypothetical protein
MPITAKQNGEFMKKLIVLTALTLTTLSNAHAFYLHANCRFDLAQGECEVVNQSYQPIYCELRAQGATRSGFWANGFVNGWIMPGQAAYVTVYSNNPYMDPLMNVNGSANCRY